MLSTLFRLAYAAAGVFLLVRAFGMMRLATSAGSSAPSRSLDRTGRRTVHPELLNEDGEVTKEELWAVRFSDMKGIASSES